VGRFKVGVQIHPQRASIDELRAAWKEAEAVGVDSLWTWDHFFPLRGGSEGAHFEGWSLLAAMACDTERALFGMLVTCNSYRNPELLADMARTIDHLSGGRMILGIGAGWFERDYDEYGYEFGTARTRLQGLEESLPRIKERLAKLDPPPLGDMPILIGGGGEKVTLRLVAEHADMWNGGGSAEVIAHKNEVLDRWCSKVGRDPNDIERSVIVNDVAGFDLDAMLRAGAQHIILGRGSPFDFSPVKELVAAARS